MTDKVSFSSGSESRDIIRRVDLLRKRVPNRRCGIFERPLTADRRTKRYVKCTVDTSKILVAKSENFMI